VRSFDLNSIHVQGFPTQGLAMTRTSLYVTGATGGLSMIRRLQLTDGQVQAEHSDEEYQACCEMSFGPAGALVFANFYNGGVGTKIAALDVLTLEERYAFGQEQFSHAADGLAVVGSAVYVGDAVDGVMRVYSLSGQHLRTVDISFDLVDISFDLQGGSLAFCCVDDRLVVHECSAGSACIIYVTNTECEFLQAYQPTEFEEDDAYVNEISRFGDKLLVVRSTAADSGGRLYAVPGA
jgi:hypothetical protein